MRARNFAMVHVLLYADDGLASTSLWVNEPECLTYVRALASMLHPGTRIRLGLCAGALGAAWDREVQQRDALDVLFSYDWRGVALINEPIGMCRESLT